MLPQAAGPEDVFWSDTPPARHQNRGTPSSNAPAPTGVVFATLASPNTPAQQGAATHAWPFISRVVCVFDIARLGSSRRHRASRPFCATNPRYVDQVSNAGHPRPTPARILPILTTTREPPHGLVPCTRAEFSLLCTSDICLSWSAMQQPVPGLSVDSSLSCPLAAARPHLRQIARVSSCCRVTVCTAPGVPDWDPGRSQTPVALALLTNMLNDGPRSHYRVTVPSVELAWVVVAAMPAPMVCISCVL